MEEVAAADGSQLAGAEHAGGGASGDHRVEHLGVVVGLAEQADTPAVAGEEQGPIGPAAGQQLAQVLVGGRRVTHLELEGRADLGPDERSMAQKGGLHIGRVIDERQAHFGPGDFLIRAVLGADRESGAVAIGDEAEVGATLQFQVRDAASADEDLRELLAGRRADGALLFTCNGRGIGLFGEPDHDAAVLDAVVAGGATAGMFCAGELGPVGGRNFLHGYTASMILFTDPLG